MLLRPVLNISGETFNAELVMVHSEVCFIQKVLPVSLFNHVKELKGKPLNQNVYL